MPMLEYVMSGTGHSKIHYNSSLPDVEVKKYLNKYIGVLNSSFTEQKFSMLYNAYQEKRYGVNMKDHLELFGIHADSGGLQMVTGNKTISEKMKNEVYKHQAKYSTVAMSFDVIPIKQDSNIAINNMKLRKFDRSRHVECATSSAKNIIRQIECFEEMNSSSKVMAIMQGNCLSSVVEWCDILFDVIPKEYHSKIFGISVSGAVMGTGEMEDIERIFAVSQMKSCPPNIIKNLHLLGIGSYKRLVPSMVMRKEGVIDKNTHISYDSTTHTYRFSMGEYFYVDDGELGRNIIFTRKWDKVLEKVYGNIEELFGVISELNISKSLFLDITAMNTTDYIKKYDNKFMLERHIISFLMCLGSVYNFMKTIDLIESKQLHYEISPALYGIGEIKNVSDFNYWKSFSKSKIKSTRVQTSDSVDLSAFF